MPVAPLLVLLLAVPPAASAVEDYLLFFAADGIPYRPDRGHSFAALVRVEQAPGCAPRVVEVASLSWLPATMKVRALAPRSEVGRNVPLEETLHVSLASGGRVCLWGPYRVCPELAETFKARIATVETTYRYKAACRLAPRNVCDCARSLEETVVPRRRYIGAFGYGAAAVSVIVREFSPWLIEPEQAHPWVATLLGLDECPLIRRPFGDSTSRQDQLRAAFRKR
jgi:hypothetical protein